MCFCLRLERKGEMFIFRLRTRPAATGGTLAAILDMTDTTEILSPDNNFKLHFYDAIEPRMGMTMSKFSLVDLRTKDKVKSECENIVEQCMNVKEAQRIFKLRKINKLL